MSRRTSLLVLAGLLVVLAGVLAVQIPRALRAYYGPEPVPELDLPDEAACLEALESSWPTHRRAGATRLGEWGAASAGAVPALTRALQEEADPGVVSELAWALQQVGAPGAPGLLEELTRPGDWHRRDYAAFLLGGLPAASEQSVPALARTLRDDPEGGVRASAARALEALGVAAPAALEALQAASADPDPEVRDCARGALRRLAPAAPRGE